MSRSMRELFVISLLVYSSHCDYSSVNVPIGVGEPQDDRDFKHFGSFGEFLTDKDKSVFVTCGKKTVDTLNEQFADASTEVNVLCEPSPTRVIVTQSKAAVNYGNFERDLKKECELLVCSTDAYEPQGADLGVLENGAADASARAPIPENPERSVCRGNKPAYSGASTASLTLFTNEGNCFHTYADIKKTMNSDIARQFVQVPRWLKKGEERFNLRSLYFAGDKDDQVRPVPYSFKTPTTPADGQKYEECKTACDVGSTVKLIMRDSAYRAMVYLEPTCPSFKICIDPKDFDLPNKHPICEPQKTIDVLVDNGVVVWPNKGRASLIELKSAYHGAEVVPIEFGYGTGDPKDPTPEYFIGNDHREIVTSDSKGFSKNEAARLAFVFPNEKCLKRQAGIYSRFIHSGSTWTSIKVEKVGGEYQIGQGFDLVPIKKPQEHKAVDTSNITITSDVDMPSTTTPAPQRVSAEGAVLDASSSALETDNLSESVFAEGKWWTWGIYIGFVIGTLFTLGVGGAIFWFIRRTVFSVWYRGMYKRYGCDASGTTGGLTGIGFGQTATGDMTVNGTSATTGGNTTRGDSTTGGDSTKSTSMLTTK